VRARLMVPAVGAAGRQLVMPLLGSVWLLLSCSSDSQRVWETAHDGGDADAAGGNGAVVLLRISDQNGSRVEQYVAVLPLADGVVLEASCPAEPGGGHECTEQGLRVEGNPDRFEVTVKARGYEFVTRQFVLAELPSQGDSSLAQVTLRPLEPFEQNDDYATGFEAGAGLESFQQLAAGIDTELGPTHVVKFTIDQLDQQPRVFFQNTRSHPLHYGFARTVLGAALSLSDYEAATYHGADRTALAGSLTHYPAVQARSACLDADAQAPIAVTFFPSDDLTVAQAYQAHRLLEERMLFAPLTGGQQRITYLPAGEVQEAQLAASVDVFDHRGAAWLTHQEVYGSLSIQILNDGLAYGRLRALSPSELESTVVSFSDILVLTRLPNWLPVVAGTITEELQTPLAHVNVAARTRGTPNIALLNASQDGRVAELLGQLVRFEVADGTFTLQPATLEQVQSFWDSRELEPITPSFDVARDGLPGFADLSFEDSLSVGVKAANLAELHQVLGEQAPDGFAVPFHYYDQFMQAAQVTVELCSAAHAQCTTEGRSTQACDAARDLCASVPQAGPELLWDHVTRLLGDGQLQSDSEIRDAALAMIRYHVTHLEVDPEFGEALDARVAEVFGDTKARIRSSTNTEDLPDFTGAGLYESVSAYASGASAASNMIREVWASVWGWRAFEERAYWNIDHLAVRMGCAVNQAFGDELANGVLITQNIADPSVAGMYANVQLGEASVTNPPSGALPEVFSIIPSPQGGTQVARQRLSSLSPDAPLLSDSEIATLYLAATTVQYHFAELYGENPNVLALDLEFKFTAPDRSLVIKQARPYSQQW
jgi:pyruvate,water dikinase